jgi:hypothetical protein
MKRLLPLSLVLTLTLAPVQAQHFRPGGDHGRWHGAGYGYGHGYGVYRPGVSISYGYGYWPGAYVYRSAPVYVYDDVSYDTVGTRPNYAGNGLLWGAIAGAIIGNNSGSLGHDAWRGSAYGAGAGLLLGAIAENNARRREAAAAPLVISGPPAAATAVPAPTAPPAPVVPRPAPTTPMTEANRMFGRN